MPITYIASELLADPATMYAFNNKFTSIQELENTPGELRGNAKLDSVVFPYKKFRVNGPGLIDSDDIEIVLQFNRPIGSESVEITWQTVKFGHVDNPKH